MHGQQRVADGRADFGQQRLRTVSRDLEQQLARQRIAVGVQSGGGQPEQHVARADRLAGEQFAALGRADDEARQVVLAVGVQPRHLRRLAADQRAAVRSCSRARSR